MLELEVEVEVGTTQGSVPVDFGQAPHDCAAAEVARSRTEAALLEETIFSV